MGGFNSRSLPERYLPAEFLAKRKHPLGGILSVWKKELQNGDVAQKKMSPEMVLTKAATDKRLQLPFWANWPFDVFASKTPSATTLSKCICDCRYIVVKQMPGSVCEARYMSV